VSIDPSLKVKSGALSQRSVLSRAERIERLRKARKWHDGDTVLGLPKVRTVFKQKGKKKAAKPKAEAGATPAEGAPAEGAAAAPAAAAPAAEAKKGKK
jgi:small basic protein (TIGR04137 family)